MIEMIIWTWTLRTSMHGCFTIHRFFFFQFQLAPTAPSSRQEIKAVSEAVSSARPLPEHPPPHPWRGYY